MITVRHPQNKNIGFKYLQEGEVLNFIMKKEWVSLQSYKSRKEAALAELLNLALVNKAFYVVRSSKMNGNGIFLDKREALRFKKELVEHNAVLTVEPNTKAVYNLIGNRKLAIDKIKEAQKVVGTTLFTVNKKVTEEGLDFMKSLMKKYHIKADFLNNVLVKSKIEKESAEKITNAFKELFPKKKVENVSEKLSKNIDASKVSATPLVTITVPPIVTDIVVEQEKVDFVDKTQNVKKTNSRKPATNRKNPFFIESVTSKSNMNPTIKVYCDGSYSDRLGGFYGFAAYDGDTLITQKTGFIFDGLFGKSSSGAENMSIINALEWAYSNDIKEIEIFYDAEDNISPLLHTREQNAIRTTYRTIVEKFLNVMDVKFTYVEKNESLHHTRHNLINNLIYNKRDIIAL